ncbi:MAG TPA: SPFH domain-containing protein [Polyangia bacterium]|jgi:regulator of protease activity HflC (stomatin/prohibitin superfamily)|nr:SPFH domain-containing protein [Polyangia bacterium]
MRYLRSVGHFFRRLGYLVHATAWAVVLGIIETLRSERGRRALALVSMLAVGGGVVYSHPLRTIPPGEVGVRVNRLTGGMRLISEGWVVVLPGLHELRRYSLREQIYRPTRSARSTGEAPYQSVEGLSIGADVSVRYALEPTQLLQVARRLPEDVGRQLVEPTVDGILHRVFATHTVREIFSSQRADIQQAVAAELRSTLAADGVKVQAVYLGNVDLPAEYRSGIEALLTEELSAEKMRYTIELKEKKIKESEFEAEAEKVRRQKAAEAAGLEEVIAAQAKAEAMKHVLPFKEKEIEQRRLEAEAAKVGRIKQAEGEAEARKIDAVAEAEARRRLAESDAYRLEVTGKANSEQLARESELIRKNPLLIQKTLADKLSDKIQVIVAPPQAGGFFAGQLLGMRTSSSGEARGESETNQASTGE